MIKKKIGIIGTGSWGLSLSLALSRNDLNILLWFKSEERFNEIKLKKESKLLSGIKIPKKIHLTTKIKELDSCEYIFLVTPSQLIRKNLEFLKILELSKKKIVICSKGIENETNKLMSEVVNEIYPNVKVIIFSGPNFAIEVANNLPTAYVLSSEHPKVAKKLGILIAGKNFRPYFNKDIIGTQIGGSLKNVIAIACGIVLGKGLGENAKASVMTRGLAEITELGKKMGAKDNTFRGLSGLGDLNLSCNSLKSRNMLFGYKLGKGSTKAELIEKNILSEGVNSCEAICELGIINNVNLPICNAVKEVLDGKSISNVILNLLARPLQFEV